MLPWYEHARRDPDALVISDCRKCLGSQPRMVRQSLACHYEPKIDNAHPWDHQGRKPAPYEDKQPKMCAGYVCTLPQVVEARRAHLHWNKGQLDVIAPEPTERLVECIEIYHYASNSLESWLMTPRSKGGGRED